MRIKYLGTAAAEAIPALFCTCETCREARKAGGRELRLRSQALINDTLLIDLNGDTAANAQRFGLDMTRVFHCLITHVHSDHFCVPEFFYVSPGFTHRDGMPPLTVHGSEDVAEALEKSVAAAKGALVCRFEPPFTPFDAGGVRVTALKASHGIPHPYIYLLEQEGKAILYAHDTGPFPEETWDYLGRSNVRLSLVSLDCNDGDVDDIEYDGHMCVGRCKRVRDRLKSTGIADESAVFVLNHFSHNGVRTLYRDMSKIAEREGFIASYDGLELTV